MKVKDGNDCIRPIQRRARLFSYTDENISQRRRGADEYGIKWKIGSFSARTASVSGLNCPGKGCKYLFPGAPFSIYWYRYFFPGAPDLIRSTPFTVTGTLSLVKGARYFVSGAPDFVPGIPFPGGGRKYLIAGAPVFVFGVPSPVPVSGSMEKCTA